MNKLNGTKIQYNHPASPLFGIKLNEIYTVVCKNKNIFIVGDNINQEIKLDLLTQLFNPLESNWDEILKEEVKEEVVIKSESKILNKN